MKFNKMYLQYMLEAKPNANTKEVGKRISQEMMSYINNRKDDMKSSDYSKAKKMVDVVVKELNPETIFDDLMAIGKMVGLKNSYSRLVGRVLTIANELEDMDSTKAKILGEPEEEPEEDEEI